MTEHTYPTAVRWAQCHAMATELGMGITARECWHATSPLRKRHVARRPKPASNASDESWDQWLEEVLNPSHIDQRLLWDQRQKDKQHRHAVLHRTISPALRREVLASGPCFYCGKKPTQIDHMIPVSRGGTRVRHNLVPACRRCNQAKGNWTAEEFDERWHQVFLSVLERLKRTGSPYNEE